MSDHRQTHIVRTHARTRGDKPDRGSRRALLRGAGAAALLLMAARFISSGSGGSALGWEVLGGVTLIGLLLGVWFQPRDSEVASGASLPLRFNRGAGPRQHGGTTGRFASSEPSSSPEVRTCWFRVGAVGLQAPERHGVFGTASNSPCMRTRGHDVDVTASTLIQQPRLV